MMDSGDHSLYDEGYVKAILSDIRLAIKRLENIGFHSLVIIASGDQHFEIGSTTGIQFSLDNFGYVENFMEYCQDVKPFDMSTLTNEELGTVDGKTKVYEWHRPLETQMKTSLSDIKTEGDSDLESDVDAKSWEQRDDIEDTEPGNNIVVINVNKQKNIKGTKAGRTMRKTLERKVPKVQKQIVSKTKAIKKVSSQEVPKETRYYHCDQCEKQYLAKKDLIIHMRLHTGDTPFHCDVCSKGFRSRGLLRGHMQMHNTEKKYPCDVCGLRFLRKQSVYRHKLKQHSEKRPSHICDVCGLSFEDSSVLRMHKFRHAGYKPHMCTVCGRSFLEKRSLVAHQLIHTGEKPIKCETCGEGFRMKKNLVTHQRRKHAEKQGQAVVIKIISSNYAEHIEPVSEESTE